MDHGQDAEGDGMENDLCVVDGPDAEAGAGWGLRWHGVEGRGGGGRGGVVALRRAITSELPQGNYL